MTFHENSAQRLENYVDQLYFGMLSNKPDKSIKNFVEKYIPVVYKKFDSGGTWIMYPPDLKEPDYITVINSYIFNSHPYFMGKFKSGQLAITQKIYSEPQWNENITDVKLWFEFDNEQDAKYDLNKLIDTCSNFKVLKKLSSDRGVEKAEFTDENSENYYSTVQIVLLKDYLIGKRYVAPTKEGFETFREFGYKISFFVGTDMF